MKTVAVVFLLFFWIGFLSAQMLVVNSDSSVGVFVPVQDTSISSINPETALCALNEYHLDLDQDSMYDVTFSLNCYMSGWMTDYSMTITPLNNFTIHLDTNYIEYFQYIDWDTGHIRDTTRKTSVVKKYFLGDTIYDTFLSTMQETTLLKYNWVFEPRYVGSDIDLFLGDTSYIAFTKDHGNLLSLYCVKIYIPYRGNLQIISAKTNDKAIGIHENLVASNYIYPNPVVDKINIRKGCAVIEIYSYQGELINKTILANAQTELDLSWLNSGFFIIRLHYAGYDVVNKFVKL